MKKTFATAILCILLIESLAAQNDRLLDFYFGDASYSRVELALQNPEGNILNLAFVPPASNDPLVRKGIIYSYRKNEIVPYMYILGPYVISNRGVYLIDASVAPGAFWGWKVTESRDLATHSIKGLIFALNANNGSSVTDGISIMWNQKIEVFSVIAADRSQW